MIVMNSRVSITRKQQVALSRYPHRLRKILRYQTRSSCLLLHLQNSSVTATFAKLTVAKKMRMPIKKLTEAFFKLPASSQSTCMVEHGNW